MGADVEAAVGPAAGRLGSRQGERRFAPALLDVALDGRLGCGRDDRADPGGGVVGRADHEAACRLDQALQELVVGLLQHDHPGTGRALLPLIAEGRDDRLEHRDVEVGVGVDDDRVLAAELGDHALDPGAAGLLDGARHDAQAHGARAGEGDEVDLGMGDQRLADLVSGAR